MRRLVIAAAALSAGCHDAPALDIDVTHPAGLAIAETGVTVYESPTLTCDDIEFGRLDDAQLAALTTAEETLATGGAITGTLDGISRTASKIIVARDYDATGALLAAGCTALGSVSSDTTVPITTIVAATVAILPPSQAGSATIVTAFDPTGAPIDGRAISWTVYGPAGSTPATTTGVTVTADGEWSPAAPTCTTQGTANVHVVPPNTVGGYAVQLQVAWATSAPPLFSDLTSAQIVPQDTGGPTSCAIRHHGGAQSLICLTSGSLNDTATSYIVNTSGGVATLARAGSAQAIAQSTFALVSLPDGSDLDVYSIDDTGALTNLFDAPPSSLTTPCKPLAPCDEALAMPACGSAEPGRILIHENGSEIAVIDENGTTTAALAVPGFFPKFGTAGCVTELSGSGSTLLQAATLTSHASSSTAFEETYLVACDATACKAFDLQRGNIGIGFLGGTEPRIVLESIDATGVVLVEAVLSEQTNGVIERASVPSASIPEHILSGQFDTDCAPDLLWDIAADAKTTSFEIAYAKLAGTQPLEALSPAVAATVSQILVGDLTGDGIDDLAILATGSGSSSAGVAVVPMGASTPVTVTTDPPCAAN